MSRPTIFADTKPGQPELRAEEPAEIAAALSRIGVRFERWESQVAPDSVDSHEAGDRFSERFPAG